MVKNVRDAISSHRPGHVTKQSLTCWYAQRDVIDCALCVKWTLSLQHSFFVSIQAANNAARDTSQQAGRKLSRRSALTCSKIFFLGLSCSSGSSSNPCTTTLSPGALPSGGSTSSTCNEKLRHISTKTKNQKKRKGAKYNRNCCLSQEASGAYQQPCIFRLHRPGVSRLPVISPKTCSCCYTPHASADRQLTALKFTAAATESHA